MQTMPGHFWKFVFIGVVTLFPPSIFSQSESPLPVIIWHGMGDTCCNPLSMGALKKIIEENVPGIQVTSLQIGNNIFEDFANAYIMPISNQIDLVCKELQKDPSLKNGYNALGFSQGGLLFRGLAQRCPDPPIVNLISMMGPHQGVYGLPGCSPNSTICTYVRRLINHEVYGWIQKRLVQAQFWHDPLNEKAYTDHSLFLADINCEKDKKEEYRKNLLQLKNLVLVKALNDTVVIPKESEWFGFYKSGQDSDLYSLEDSQLYKEDWLGLKTLQESGRLHYIGKYGNHVTIDENWFIEAIIDPFLKPQSK